MRWIVLRNGVTRSREKKQSPFVVSLIDQVNHGKKAPLLGEIELTYLDGCL